MLDRLRWKIWGLVIRHPRVCPANAHGAVIWRTRPLREITVDRACRQGCADNGTCWCGKLRQDRALLIADEDVTFPADSAPSTPLDDWNW